MGVTNLWTILAPVKKHMTLSDLKGQVLAVDLSIWVCENQSVKKMHGVVVKPHLRNLFFRVLYLTQLGVKLIFVVEGKAPELKWEEMWKRQQARGLVKPGDRFKGGKQNRSQFTACLKECCELLDLLGIPHITGRGEAEAMCAALNAAGLVDACITDDGDAFLYGAKTVYRNFTMNSKDPHVESYDMSDIESELCINKHSLVGLSLLLGCDYLPGGVNGVGVANAVKLLKSLSGVNVIQRFHQWRTMDVKECVDKVEVNIRDKALKQTDFPQQQVIEEFLQIKEILPTKPFLWKKANISASQEFGLRKLDWPVDYTLEKVLPLVTLWSMLDFKQHGASSKHIQPHRIVKTRVRHGVACYEVEWIKDVWDTSSTCDYYRTIEQQSLYSNCYPHLVAKYNSMSENSRKSKKTASNKKSKKVASVDDLTVKMESASLATIDLPTDTDNLDIISLTHIHSTTSKIIPIEHSKTLDLQTPKVENEQNLKAVPFDITKLDSEIEEDVFLPLSIRVKQRLLQNKDRSAEIVDYPPSVIPAANKLSESRSVTTSVISKSLIDELSEETVENTKTKPKSIMFSKSVSIPQIISKIPKETKHEGYRMLLKTGIKTSSISVSEIHPTSLKLCNIDSVTKPIHKMLHCPNINGGDPAIGISIATSVAQFHDLSQDKPHEASSKLSSPTVHEIIRLSLNTQQTVSELQDSLATKKKTCHQKKRLKSVKKSILLLDDSVADISPDLGIIQSTENCTKSVTMATELKTFEQNASNFDKVNTIRFTKQEIIIPLQSDSNNSNTIPNQSKSCTHEEAVIVDSTIASHRKHLGDIDDMIDNVLTPRLRGMTVSDGSHFENSFISDNIGHSLPSFCSENISSALEVNSAMKLIYSAAKQGRRNMSTHNCDCDNLFTSHHPIRTPTIGVNSTCDINFGNFNIQTSLLGSDLYVSNTESTNNTKSSNNGEYISVLPNLNWDSKNEFIDVKAATDSVFQTLHINETCNSSVHLNQSPVLLKKNSNMCPGDGVVCLAGHVDCISNYVSKNKHLTFSPMSPVVPVIENLKLDRVKTFLNFSQSEEDGEIATNCIAITSVTKLTNETAYSSPIPLSLKDRLKLRLTGNNSKVLQDLSNF